MWCAHSLPFPQIWILSGLVAAEIRCLFCMLCTAEMDLQFQFSFTELLPATKPCIATGSNCLNCRKHPNEKPQERDQEWNQSWTLNWGGTGSCQEEEVSITQAIYILWKTRNLQSPRLSGMLFTPTEKLENRKCLLLYDGMKISRNNSI